MILKVTIIFIVLYASGVQSLESRDGRSLQNSNWASSTSLDNNWRQSFPRRRKSLQQEKDYYEINEIPHVSDKQWNSASYTELLRVPRDHDSKHPPPSDQYDRPPPPPHHHGRPPHDDFHGPPPHYGYDGPPLHGHFGRPPPPHPPPPRPPPPRPPPPRPPPHRPPPDQYYEHNHYSRPSQNFDAYARPPPLPPHRMNDRHPPPPHNDILPLQDRDFLPEQNPPNDREQDKYFLPRNGETGQSSPKRINSSEEDLIQLIESVFNNQNVNSAFSPGADSSKKNLNQTPPLFTRVPKDTENVNKMDSKLKDPETVKSTENPYIFDVRNGFGLENMSPSNLNANRNIGNDPISSQNSPTINKPFLIPLFQATPVTPKSN